MLNSDYNSTKNLDRMSRSILPFTSFFLVGFKALGVYFPALGSLNYHPFLSLQTAPVNSLMDGLTAYFKGLRCFGDGEVGFFLLWHLKGLLLVVD